MEIDSKTNNLSNEQLVDYIKKQKLRIKRLEKEKESLELSLSKKTNRGAGGSASSTDPTLFWDLIGRENPFYQKLARAAINSLVSTIYKSGIARQKCVPSKRAMFERWKEGYLRWRASTAEKHVEDANKTLSALEQKAAKLKALLAKTHQANQRYQEDETSFKIAQKEAAIKLKSLKERDETERMALMEAVRVRSIETAFQYDMEIAIQRAAEDMLSQQQQLHSQSQQLGSSKRIAALEEELSQVQQKLLDCDDQLNSAKRELSTLVDRNAVLEREIASRIESSLRNEQRAVDSGRKLEEETRLRKDLELELDITIRNRSEVIRELENVAEQRCARLKEHYIAEVGSMRAAMIFTDQNLEKAVAEASALRHANRALIDTSVEVTQLRATVAELRRSSAASSSAIAMSAVPSAAAVFGQQSQSWSQTSTAALSVYESLWPELIDIGKKAIKQSLTAVELYSDGNRLVSQLLSDHILAADHERERFRQLLVRRLRPDGSATAPLPIPVTIAKTLLTFLVRRLASFDGVGDRAGGRSLLWYSTSSGLFRAFLADALPATGSSSSVDTSRITTKQAQLQRRIAAAERKIARARARYEQIVVPIIFDASSMVIHAGKDLAIAIPVLRTAEEEDMDLGSDDEDDGHENGSTAAHEPKPSIKWGELSGSIEWRFGGELAGSVHLTLGSMQQAIGSSSSSSSSSSESPLKLVSKSESSGEYVGRYEINQRDGDRVLRLTNASMWGSARVSYQIRTFFGSNEQVAYLWRSKYEAEDRLSRLLAHKSEFDSAVAEGQQLLRRLRRLLDDISASGLEEDLTRVSAVFDVQLTDSSRFSEALVSAEKSVAEIRRSSMSLLKRLEVLLLGGDDGSSSSGGTGAAIAPLIEDGIEQQTQSSSVTDTDIAEGASSSSTVTAVPPSMPSIRATDNNHDKNNTNSDRISVYSCESLKIKAADDFRLVLPAPCKSRVRLSWDLEILLTGRGSSGSAGGGDGKGGRSSSKMDVGFAILEKRPDGTLPQIVPYRRVRSPGLKGEIIVDVPDYSDYENTLPPSDVPRDNHGEEIPSTRNEDSSSNSAVSYFMILFDNSYSWYHKKEIKYHITLESAPEGTELSAALSGEDEDDVGANAASTTTVASGGGEQNNNSAGRADAVVHGRGHGHGHEEEVEVEEAVVGDRNFLHVSAAHAYELSRLLEDVSDFWMKRERILRPFQDY